MRRRGERDPRLDFFRGLGMFIILIAHIPWNAWTNWIPARFGFSDAADLFVFCSGTASALAFAPIFERFGWLLGAVRIVHRMWQVYWAHIGGFLVTVALIAWADASFGGGRYAASMRVEPLLADFGAYAAGLMTLRYIPNYFDILPMYLTLLAMIPLVMALAAIHRSLAAAAVVACWLLANFGVLSLTADPVTGRQWFFNPFGWQLVFFTGFAFARGWLPAPPRDMRLAIAAGVFVLLAAPLSCQSEFPCYAGYGAVPALGAMHEFLQPVIDKTHIGALRYLHFLATAYLAYLAVGPAGQRLRGVGADIVRRVGQQTLAVFLTGLVAAQALGIALDLMGRGFLATTLVNVTGIAILILAARTVAYFKSEPWKSKSARSTAARAGLGEGVREEAA